MTTPSVIYCEMCNLLHTYGNLYNNYKEYGIEIPYHEITSILHSDEELRLKMEMVIIIKEFNDNCIHDLNIEINEENVVYTCKNCSFIREVSLRI